MGWARLDLQWVLFSDVPTFMRNEIVLRTLLPRPSAWNGRSLHHARKLIRLGQGLNPEYLAKKASPCPVPPPPLPSGASRVWIVTLPSSASPYFAARPDGIPKLWPPAWDKTQGLILLLRSIRDSRPFITFFSWDLCCASHSARTSNASLAYSLSLSLARDVTFSADECPVAACSLMKRPRTWAENFPTTMSIINLTKKVEENLFFLS